MPLFQMPVVVTRGSSDTSYASSPPHDCPITATFVVSILPRSLLPRRLFSAMAQSTASTSICASVLPVPPGRPLAMTSHTPEAILVSTFSAKARTTGISSR